VAAVPAQMDRDTVGACLFTNHCGSDDAGLRRATGLSYCCDVVDIDVESSGHSGESEHQLSLQAKIIWQNRQANETGNVLEERLPIVRIGQHLSLRPQSASSDDVVVDSLASLLSNQCHLSKHLHTVSSYVDLASFVMIPSNGYLLESQSGSISDVEKFYVKPKTVNRGPFNDRSTTFHPKSFEAALGVPEGKPRRQAYDKIKNPATLFASPGLMHANESSVEGPGAERDITFVPHDWVYEFWSLSNWRGKVGIGKQSHLSSRCQ